MTRLVIILMLGFLSSFTIAFENDSFEKRFQNLEKALLEKDQRIVKLEELVSEQLDVILNLQNRIGVLEATINKEKAGEKGRNDFDDTKKSKRLLMNMEADSNQKVAFYAEQKRSTTYALHETIHFTEELDIGDGFNSNDSIYDVPVSGVYVFSWTIQSANNAFIRVELIVNGIVKSGLISDSSRTLDVHTSTAVAVLRVNQGDHVSIRRSDSSKGLLPVYQQWSTVSFSGWLLFQSL